MISSLCTETDFLIVHQTGLKFRDMSALTGMSSHTPGTGSCFPNYLLLELLNMNMFVILISFERYFMEKPQPVIKWLHAIQDVYFQFWCMKIWYRTGLLFSAIRTLFVSALEPFNLLRLLYNEV